MDAQETTATAEAPAKTNLPRKVAAVLQLVAEGIEPLKAIKYPMPLKAPRFNLNINGETCSAAQTTFKDILYTYFEYKGASFYVPGHIDQSLSYTFQHPEGYNFEPLKLDRKAQSDAARAAKAAKAAAAPAGDGAEGGATEGGVQAPESPLEAANGGETDNSSSPASDAPVEAAADAPKKGKKVSR